MRRLLARGMRCEGSGTGDADSPIFLRNEWFALFDQFVRHSDGRTRNLCLRESGQPLVQLPLYEERSKAFRSLHSLTNYYSPIYQLLGEKPLGAEDHLAFAQKFHRYFARFDRIDLVPLAERDALYWQSAFESIGFRGFIYPYSTNWYHDGITDLDAFWAARPSSLRNTIKRKSAKLARHGGFSVDIVTPASKLELWRHLGHYHQVYFSSWKRTEPYPAFIDAIVEYAWAQGELRFGIAYHHNIPVAAQIWFVCDGTAAIFKLAYRPEYSRYSVGSILSKALFDYVIVKDRVACIDYLTGNDHYKADWMNKKRALYGIQLCNPKTLRGSIGVARNFISSAHRHVTK